MKRILCIIICVVLLLSACTVSFCAATASDTLTIIADNGVRVSANVGDIFTYTYYLNVDGRLQNIQANTAYSAQGLEILPEYEDITDPYTYATNMFPIAKDSMVSNIANSGIIKYNFSKLGTGFRFNEDSCALITANFRVKSTGTAVIMTSIEYMSYTDDTLIVKLGKLMQGQSYKSKGVLSRSVTIGDADKSGEVNIFDVSTIQRYLADIDVEKYDTIAADTNGNQIDNIMDATNIQLYLANMELPLDATVGESVLWFYE